jgi:hypothetical protein
MAVLSVSSGLGMRSLGLFLVLGFIMEALILSSKASLLLALMPYSPTGGVWLLPLLSEVGGGVLLSISLPPK